MLRAVRLASNLQLTRERSTLAPLPRMAGRLTAIPLARLFDETIKMLMCGYSSQSMEMLEKNGLAFQLFPHLKDFSASQLEFAHLALGMNDSRQRHSGSASLAFAIASLYWPQLANEFTEQPKLRQNDFMDLIKQSGLRSNGMLTKKTSLDAQNIMLGIYRLRRFYNTKRATIMLSYAQSADLVERALLLEEVRVEANETDSTVLEWWRGLIEDTQHQHTAPPTKRKPRRRRAAART